MSKHRPASPCGVAQNSQEYGHNPQHFGLSVLETFAMHAMAAYISAGSADMPEPEDIAGRAVTAAKKLVKALGAE